jgi:hypothetical protein
MAKCILTAENDPIISINSEPICKASKSVKNTQDNLFDNEKFLDKRLSSKKILIKDIHFNDSLQSYDNFSNNSNTEENFACTSKLSDGLANMSFEFEDNTNSLFNFDNDLNDSILNEFENTLQEYQELSEEIFTNIENSEDIQNISDEDDLNQKYSEFPNEAYADLMALVTKYKLSNATGNAIISFFNKHSNLSNSPLPKNIKQGKLFMNNMNSNLSYKKTEVLDHNNTKYFLYHIPLLNCIKNILEIPNISQNFIIEYEELYKTTEV